MRLGLASLCLVKGDLRVEFVRQELTSYSGLELLRRYVALLDLHRRIRQTFSAYGLAGDDGCGRVVLLIVTMLVVGALSLTIRLLDGCVASRVFRRIARSSIGASRLYRRRCRR